MTEKLRSFSDLSVKRKSSKVVKLIYVDSKHFIMLNRMLLLNRGCVRTETGKGPVEEAITSYCLPPRKFTNSFSRTGFKTHLKKNYVINKCRRLWENAKLMLKKLSN